MGLDEGMQMYKKNSLTKLMMRLRIFVLFRICGVVLLHSIAHLFEYITGLYKAQERFAKFQKKSPPIP